MADSVDKLKELLFQQESATLADLGAASRECAEAEERCARPASRDSLRSSSRSGGLGAESRAPAGPDSSGRARRLNAARARRKRCASSVAAGHRRRHHRGARDQAGRPVARAGADAGQDHQGRAEEQSGRDGRGALSDHRPAREILRRQRHEGPDQPDEPPAAVQRLHAARCAACSAATRWPSWRWPRPSSSRSRSSILIRRGSGELLQRWPREPAALQQRRPHERRDGRHQRFRRQRLPGRRRPSALVQPRRLHGVPARLAGLPAGRQVPRRGCPRRREPDRCGVPRPRSPACTKPTPERRAARRRRRDLLADLKTPRRKRHRRQARGAVDAPGMPFSPVRALAAWRCWPCWPAAAGMRWTTGKSSRRAPPRATIARRRR